MRTALHEEPITATEYRAAPAIWAHRVLPATQHSCTPMRPTLITIQSGTQFAYPKGMEG